MIEEHGHTPEKLREMAERCTRLAAGLTDARAIDALTRYARELLEEVERMEASKSVESRRAS
jgi:hypothetical protein